MSIFCNCSHVEGNSSLNIFNFHIFTSTFKSLETHVKKVAWEYNNHEYHLSAPIQIGSYSKLSSEILKSSYAESLSNVDSSLVEPNFLSKKVVVNLKGVCHGTALAFIEQLKEYPGSDLKHIQGKCNLYEIFFYSVLDYLRYHYEKEKQYDQLNCVMKFIPSADELTINGQLSLEWLNEQMLKLSSEIILLRCWTRDFTHAHTLTIRVVKELGFFELYDSNPGLGLFSFPTQRMLIDAIQSLFEAHYSYFLSDSCCELSLFKNIPK